MAGINSWAQDKGLRPKPVSVQTVRVAPVIKPAGYICEEVFQPSILNSTADLGQLLSHFVDGGCADMTQTKARCECFDKAAKKESFFKERKKEQEELIPELGNEMLRQDFFKKQGRQASWVYGYMEEKENKLAGNLVCHPQHIKSKLDSLLKNENKRDKSAVLQAYSKFEELYKRNIESSPIKNFDRERDFSCLDEKSYKISKSLPGPELRSFLSAMSSNPKALVEAFTPEKRFQADQDYQLKRAQKRNTDEDDFENNIGRQIDSFLYHNPHIMNFMSLKNGDTKIQALKEKTVQNIVETFGAGEGSSDKYYKSNGKNADALENLIKMNKYSDKFVSLIHKKTKQLESKNMTDLMLDFQRKFINDISSPEIATFLRKENCEQYAENLLNINKNDNQPATIEFSEAFFKTKQGQLLLNCKDSNSQSQITCFSANYAFCGLVENRINSKKSPEILSEVNDDIVSRIPPEKDTLSQDKQAVCDTKRKKKAIENLSGPIIEKYGKALLAMLPENIDSYKDLKQKIANSDNPVLKKLIQNSEGGYSEIKDFFHEVYDFVIDPEEKTSPEDTFKKLNILAKVDAYRASRRTAPHVNPNNDMGKTTIPSVDIFSDIPRFKGSSLTTPTAKVAPVDYKKFLEASSTSIVSEKRTEIPSTASTMTSPLETVNYDIPKMASSNAFSPQIQEVIKQFSQGPVKKIVEELVKTNQELNETKKESQSLSEKIEKLPSSASDEILKSQLTEKESRIRELEEKFKVLNKLVEEKSSSKLVETSRNPSTPAEIAQIQPATSSSLSSMRGPASFTPVSETINKGIAQTKDSKSLLFKYEKSQDLAKMSSSTDGKVVIVSTINGVTNENMDKLEKDFNGILINQVVTDVQFEMIVKELSTTLESRPTISSLISKNEEEILNKGGRVLIKISGKANLSSKAFYVVQKDGNLITLPIERKSTLQHLQFHLKN
jgi:hypothetical protein